MKYPIGIQSFESLRNDGYVYVDKTALVYKLADTGRYYFLSRPRRFGKSLLISTLEAYFSGKKELFDGLAIEELEKDWTEYPILHLDLNSRLYENADSLRFELNKHLELWERLYGSEFSDRALEERFYHVIMKAYEQTGQRVVILVDEYDKPMLQSIGNEALQDEYRNILKAFYSVLKTQDRYIRFAFLTGVTKFGKVSVFSDLNNLKDISMDERYIDICGITEAEIHRYFEEAIHDLAAKEGIGYEECCNMLKELYDGYHFETGTVGIYNPFSILNTFDSLKFGDYWFETGTPSFLVHLLKQADYNLNNLQKEQVSADVLNSIDSMSRNPIPVIYQSGYLTIKGYDNRFKIYNLGFPNKEVENGFIKYLLPLYTPVGENKTEFFVAGFISDVEKGNPDGFMERLCSLFADSDYRIAGDMEKYFQNSLYLIFKLLGFYTEVERTTSRGRMDVVLKTSDYIYVMELKLDGTAEDALRQIDERGYAAPFMSDGRKLYKIGVNFSSATRGIEKFLIE
ncbi:ATP-binding protein [Prevotella sp. PCHR]|uniref:ATP-binding protein n=3 Tax=Xylanibacter caecicola TaxID=2736294 RepID=A0ABX2B1V4_9BACT|nr:ATP-binding protein [Xylanibacter caecicola]NPE24788.1 ATP-binding protein [Xylanibacter caecicola]